MNNIINISSDNISGKCDFKCSYTYNYLNTNVVAKKNSNMISLINDGIEPVVTYNNNNYMVSATMIVSPSLHKFNNNKTDGEILIEHMPIQGGQKMYVCIPITQSADFSNASVIIALVIESIKADAPAENDTIRVTSDNFNLNSFVPKGQFYSYSGYDLNEDVSDFVVFGIENAITMNQSIFNSLTEIIQPISALMKGGDLFLNEKGPNVSTSDVGTSDVGTSDVGTSGLAISGLSTSGLAISGLSTSGLSTSGLGTSGLGTSGLGTSSSSSDTPVTAEVLEDDSNSSPFIDNDNISSIIQIILNCLFFFTLFYIINVLFNYLFSSVNNKIYSIT